MFQKKNNKKPLYSSLSLIELAIFLPFPLAYSSDIANVSTGVRLESWQRSGEKRTLPHPPSSTDTFPLLLSLQLSCNKSSEKACYADYFASNGDFISYILFYLKKKSFWSWKLRYPVWAAIKIENLYPCLRLKAPQTILIGLAVPRVPPFAGSSPQDKKKALADEVGESRVSRFSEGYRIWSLKFGVEDGIKES